MVSEFHCFYAILDKRLVFTRAFCCFSHLDTGCETQRYVTARAQRMAAECQNRHSGGFVPGFTNARVLLDQAGAVHPIITVLRCFTIINFALKGPLQRLDLTLLG